MHTLIHDYWRLGYALAEPKVPGMRQFLFRKLFNPVSEMFRNSEQGVWYDPSDMSTLFQDAAGTVPVTAVGQPVGRMLDKSGRGNHATQTTSVSRPTLQIDTAGNYCLSFDGVDDFLVTGNINFSATDKMTVWAGVRKISNARGIVVELNDGSVGSNRCFTLNCAINTAYSGAISPFYNYEINVHGSVDQERGDYASFLTKNAFPSPDTSVLAGTFDIALKNINSAKLRVNAVIPERQSGSFTGDGMSGNFPVAPLYIGRRGGTTLPFNGKLYGLVIRGALSNPADIAALESFMNRKAKAY